jgi:perosamine synthetase
MAELGYNYRLPDILCALGMAQLSRLDGWVAARQKIARFYDRAFACLPQVAPLYTHPDRTNAYHLYVVRLAASLDRDRVFAALRAEGIGANVHYAPVYWHSFYQARGYRKGLCPVAERVSQQILTLPMFPAMTEDDVNRVVEAVTRATA